jgi:hypothetical protein
MFRLNNKSKERSPNPSSTISINAAVSPMGNLKMVLYIQQNVTVDSTLWLLYVINKMDKYLSKSSVWTNLTEHTTKPIFILFTLEVLIYISTWN